MQAIPKTLFTFSFKVLYFILPIALLSYPLDWAISHYLRQSKTAAEGEYVTWNAIYSKKMKVELAIYGSSRAWVHVNPQILTDSLHQSTYNFGIDGLGFKAQYLRHRIFLAHNPQPTHIILCIDERSLQIEDKLYNKSQFLPYLLYNKTLYDHLNTYKGFDLSDYTLPLVRYYGQSKALNSAFWAFLKPENEYTGRIKGYQGQDKTWNNDFDKAKQAQQALTIQIDTNLIVLFNDFIQECTNKNIKLTFVYTPEYIEGQYFIKNKDAIMNFYKNKAHTHHIRFIDFSNDPLCFDKTYFYNALHLNKKGSEIFSRQLVDSLR